MATPYDAADVAATGFDAMLRGDAEVVTGSQSKLRAAISGVTPMGIPAKVHRGMAAPGWGAEKR